jgi:hypothetical protein
MDVHVPFAITVGLRRRGIDVLTAQEDDSSTLEDDQLLPRAALLGRVLFTQDNGFRKLTYMLVAQGLESPGVLFASQEHPIGACIEELHLAAEAMKPEELANRFLSLPEFFQ